MVKGLGGGWRESCYSKPWRATWASAPRSTRSFRLRNCECGCRLAVWRRCKEIAEGGSFIGCVASKVNLAPLTKQCSEKPAKTEYFPAKRKMPRRMPYRQSGVLMAGGSGSISVVFQASRFPDGIRCPWESNGGKWKMPHERHQRHGRTSYSHGAGSPCVR